MRPEACPWEIFRSRAFDGIPRSSRVRCQGMTSCPWPHSVQRCAVRVWADKRQGHPLRSPCTRVRSASTAPPHAIHRKTLFPVARAGAEHGTKNAPKSTNGFRQYPGIRDCARGVQNIGLTTTCGHRAAGVRLNCLVVVANGRFRANDAVKISEDRTHLCLAFRAFANDHQVRRVR